MKSALYIGPVRHRRFHPKIHDFKYWMAYFFIDLDEVDSTFRYPLLFSQNKFNLFSFRRQNYLRPTEGTTLREAVDLAVHTKFGRHIEGPVRILTQISYLGFCFNPVTFYYCYDAKDEMLQYIVADVTNTPWNERHAYVVECKAGEKLNFVVPKEFHVSPFMHMEMVYKWNFTEPGKALTVHMENEDIASGLKYFDATLTLRRRELTLFNFCKTFFTFPLMTFKAVILIYIEAILLKVKKLEYVPKPKGRT